MQETTSDFEALRREAEGGRPELMAAVGDRLLIGRDAPFDPQAGLALVQAAAERGDPDALDRMATLVAAGAWVRQSLAEAFDYLHRAAAAGSIKAQTQLLLLAEDPDLAARARAGQGGDEIWRLLADTIRPASWTESSPRRPVSEEPRIRVADRFISPEICDWLISKARGRMKPGLMYNGKEAVQLPTRNCSDFIFDIVSADVVVTLVRLRISATTRLPVEVLEPFQIFHYALGQELKAHYDHVRDALSVTGQSDSESERIATFLIYLNDDYDGGDLDFLKTGFRFRGRKGDGIFFANVTLDGKPDRLSLHAALPVTRGEKWMVSQWIQDRPVFKGA